MLRCIGKIRAQSGGRPIVVVIPELVKEHWWDYVLTTQRAHRLRAALVRHSGPDLAVVIVPWAREARILKKSSRRKSRRLGLLPRAAAPSRQTPSLPKRDDLSRDRGGAECGGSPVALHCPDY